MRMFGRLCTWGVSVPLERSVMATSVLTALLRRSGTLLKVVSARKDHSMLEPHAKELPKQNAQLFPMPSGAQIHVNAGQASQRLDSNAYAMGHKSAIYAINAPINQTQSWTAYLTNANVILVSQKSADSVFQPDRTSAMMIQLNAVWELTSIKTTECA